MSPLKIRLLIGLLVFGFLISLVWIYFSSKQAQPLLPPPPPATPETAEEKLEVSGSNFDRAERDDKLQAEADALLNLFDNMPPVPVYIKDEPLLESGTNTERGSAYTHCEKHRFPTIFVKKTFYQKANRKRLVNALKHELTHAWLCRQQMMWGHDERFRRKFKEVGGFGN